MISGAVDQSELNELLAKAKAKWDAMTPEERKRVIAKQRRSYVVGEMALSDPQQRSLEYWGRFYDADESLPGIPPLLHSAGFCIRHKPTGKVIPCAEGRMGRGGSWVEPMDPATTLPRVFSEVRYAKSWLTTWLKGGVKFIWDIDYESGHMEPSMELVHQPHRKREEYEIVEFAYTLKEPAS